MANLIETAREVGAQVFETWAEGEEGSVLRALHDASLFGAASLDCIMSTRGPEAVKGILAGARVIQPQVRALLQEYFEGRPNAEDAIGILYASLMLATESLKDHLREQEAEEEE